MKIYFIELEEDRNFIYYEKYMKFLSLEKQTKINKFKYDIDKKLSLIADLFIRYLAFKELNISNSDITIKTNKYKKPYLFGFPDFHYNISHTRNAILIGSSNEPVGVDIEKIKVIDLKILEYFCSENELNYILSDPTEQDRRFYEIWTKKEAYIKWIGKGFLLNLLSFDVTVGDISKLLYNFEINGYMLSFYSKEKFNISDIKILNEYMIFNILKDLTDDFIFTGK